MDLVGIPASPSSSNPEPPLGLRAFPFVQTDPAEKVWVEVEPVGPLKEGDHVKIRCLTDGNPQPHFTINKKVQSAPYWVHGGDIRVRAEVETVSRWHQLILTPLCSPRTPALGRWKRKALMKMGSSPWSLPRSTIVGSTNVRA